MGSNPKSGRNRMIRKLLISSLLIGSAAPASPDTPGEIRGVVIDSHTEQPLPGVNVFILDSEVGTASDAEGRFYLERLPPGSYHVRFEMMGYQPQTKLNLPVSPGRDLTLTIRLVQTVLEMQNVVVTPDFFKKAKDAVISDRSVDFTEIVSDPGSSMDIQRMMQALPSVVSGSDQYNEVVVRGGAPGENLFVFDHIEMPNPNHFGVQGWGGGPISMINPLFIDEVDFYAGSFPARYGDKASSVMDVKFREGSRKHFDAELDMGMAGIGTLLEGPLHKERGSYLFSLHKSYLDLIIANTGLTAVPQYYNMQGKIVYDLTESHKLIWNGVLGNDRIEIGTADIHGTSDVKRVDVKGYEYGTGISWKGLWRDDLYSLLTLYRVENNWTDAVFSPAGTSIFRQNDTEAALALKGDLVYRLNKGSEITTGFQIKRIDLDFNRWAQADTLFGYGYLVDGESQIRFLSDWPYDGIVDEAVVVDTLEYYAEWGVDKPVNSTKYAAHLQYKFNPVKPLTVVAGVRYDYFAYTDYHSLSPRAGLSFSLTPVTKISCGYGKNYQTPVNYDLVKNPLNGNLKSKYTDQWVVGLEHLLARDIRATLELYTRRYHDLAIPRSRTTPDSIDSYDDEMVNAGRGHVEGLELFFQKKLYDRFHWILSYSYYVSKLEDPRFPGEEYNSSFDYRNVFTLVLGYKEDLRSKAWYRKMKETWWYKATAWLLPFGDEVEVSLRWRYLGGKPYTPQNFDPYTRRWYVSAHQMLNRERFPEYHRLDIMLTQRYIFEKMNLVVYLDLQNVYNRDNIWDYAYGDDGEIETIYQYKLFPVGGFILEF